MLVKNDRGIVLRLTIQERGKAVDLSGMIVSVIFKNGDVRTEKQASVVEAAEGRVEVTIDEEETGNVGILDYQVKVQNISGERYSSSIDHIAVYDEL